MDRARAALLCWPTPAAIHVARLFSMTHTALPVRLLAGLAAWLCLSLGLAAQTAGAW